jgi:hypothetical protein
MKKIFVLIFIVSILTSCFSAKQTTTQAPEPRIAARFDYSPPSRVQAGSSGITIAIVKPTYVGKNPEYYVAPFKEMAARMGNDFEELLTAKGFTVRGPFGSRDEMVYNDKLNSNFIIEIGIDINPLYNTKKYPTTKTNWGSLFDKAASATTTTYKTAGEVVLAGNLVINAKSSQYGELIWKKSIALESTSFSYTGSLVWNGPPSMAEELNQDNVVYNTISKELEKFYNKALGIAWQQIDPDEMKVVGDQAKKADKKQ